MTSRGLVVTLALGALVMAPLAAFSADTSAFAVFVNPVKNRVALTFAEAQARQVKDGAVEITSLSKVEADAAGDVLGQTTFFFPMESALLADFLASSEGVCSLAMLAESAKVVKSSPDKKNWTGEMKVNLDKIQREGSNLRTLWSPSATTLLQSHKDRQYTTRFEVKREDAADLTTIRYTLANGNILKKAEVTLRVQANGREGALVTISTRTHSTALEDMASRIQLAKQVLRSMPKVLDQGLAKLGR